jgi:pimeloyl-ACP methyl ester carboxylesterase
MKVREGTGICFAALLLASGAFAETRMVSIGDRKLSISCTGIKANATVVLAAGAGRISADWSKVEPEVAKFTRVCSYDRAGLGASEKTAKSQSLDEVLVDLHTLLAAAAEHGPFVLVGHSLGAVYVRHYATKYPAEVSGLVLVDSAHEEQVWRFREIAPSMGAPADDGFLTKRGELLDWHTTLPMIVLSHGELTLRDLPPGMTEAQLQAIEKVWQELQVDLAKRSPKGELRRLMRSHHFIQADQPDVVIQAIRDVWQQSR